MAKEIKARKVFLKNVFKMWFRIPSYQRPYVWEKDQISDLLDDITYAQSNSPNAEYFLGSFVFQSITDINDDNLQVVENDLLDGQQRITTLILIFAVMRDLFEDNERKKKCQNLLYQQADIDEGIPERPRLLYDIDSTTPKFIDQYITNPGHTCPKEESYEFDADVSKYKNITVKNLANAIKVIYGLLCKYAQEEIVELFQYMLNKVLVIYVYTEDLEDAFRLFTILNDRGVPLRNSDILKSENLRALNNREEEIEYRKLWEQAEGELDEEFDRFLNYIRTILVKEKARQSLLTEFKDKIYNPKEKDKSTGKARPPLLKKGKPTFQFIERYLDVYKELMGGSLHDLDGRYGFTNLITIMEKGFLATDWIPPVMRYYDKFRTNQLVDFLHQINRKFAADWLCQYTPTTRIENMNNIIQAVEDSSSPENLLSHDLFAFDSEGLLAAINGKIYGRRFARYVMLMLDYCVGNQRDEKMNFDTLSIEHVLPQNPAVDSEWTSLFSDEQREKWTHKLGNLVMITRRKNSSLSRKPFEEKKETYFDGNVETRPYTLQVLHRHSTWDSDSLKDNHRSAVSTLSKYFRLSTDTD